MAVEYLDFTEETFPLVEGLVVSRFGANALPALRRILDNPLRRRIAPAGCIGMKDGKAVCFKAATVRRAYLGQEEWLGLVGGYFCKAEKGCPLSVVLEVRERAEWNRYPCRGRFGNTCIYATMRMNAQLGAQPGPAGWESMRFGVVHPLRFLRLLARRKLLRRPQPAAPRTVAPEVESGPFARLGAGGVFRLVSPDAGIGDFWRRYLSGNRGIVASRDPETLEWLFGGAVRAGKCLMLALRRQDAVEGFIVLGPMPGSPFRWRILDLIALENDPVRLETLLRGARACLRRETEAITMEATGFPDFVQPVLDGTMPHVRKTGHNRFEWLTDDGEIRRGIEKTGNSPDGWFFGPFDGDYCM